MGDYYGVINDYDQAINLNSNDALYFYKRGFAKQKIGNIKGACSDAKRSIALGYIDEANKRWVADMCN
ncbi:tetratricopeptide repeat protein [Prochlorococcus sp. AH-716-O22]|nr:tetratricopeptide repeat protein [Prochlorococcus sp. AH-716-O22]